MIFTDLSKLMIDLRPENNWNRWQKPLTLPGGLGNSLKMTSSDGLGRPPAGATTVAKEDDGGVHIVGLVSDTHGVVEEATILALRQATKTIIHAG